MKITLRQLEVFLAVAQHHGVSRAAAQLSMSQSAASAALSELERLQKVQLFDRIGKRVQLNDLGRAMVPRAAELLDRAREFEAALHSVDAVGDLRIGATLTIGNYLATLIVSEHMQRFPDSKVTLAVENTAHIIAKVADMQLELGLIEGTCRHPDIETIPWRKDELVVFAAPDHPLARKRRVTPADIAAAAWIVREPGSGTRETFDRAAAALPTVHIRLELAHTEAIKRTVESGLGVGCISQLTLRDELKRGTLVKLSTPFLNMRREFLILVHRRKYRSAATRQFITQCLQYRGDGE